MYFSWKPRLSTAALRAKAERNAATLRKKDSLLAPVAARSGAIARTFWGKAWCTNLERYSDFDNRLPRGRSYLRHGAVIDLRITQGKVAAQVVGSRLYKVEVKVAAVPAPRWNAICTDCTGTIDSLVELLQGRLSQSVMERLCRPQTGLFPAPKEIVFTCSCPDWAAMCKHVAAALYAVGARMDEQPEVLFTLRKVDANALVARAGAGLGSAKQGPAAGKTLDASKLGELFGIDMAAVEPATPATRKTIARKSAGKAKARKPAAKVSRTPVAKRKSRRKKG